MIGTALLCVGGLVVSLGLSGCSGNGDSRPQSEFFGVVTFDDKPMEEGSIHFTSPKTGESAFCNLGEGGAYQVTFPGGDLNESYEVTIKEAVVDTEGIPAHEMPPPVKLSVSLPQRYRQRPTSGLRATLEKPGKNHVDFALTTP